MTIEIFMPRLGLTMQEGTIVAWLKNEGEAVLKGDPVVEIVSEKLSNVVEAPGTGMIEKLLFPAGTTVPSGTVIACIKEAEDSDNMPEIASDAAAENAQKAVQKSEQQELKIKEAIPLTGIRKIISDRMTESLHRSPQASVTTRVDMSGLTAMREEHARSGLKYSYTDYMVKIIAHALQENPLLNASVQDGEILVYESVNIGVAVAADCNLVVPVVKDVLNKSLSEIAGEVHDLAKRAREGKLVSEELSGGTFTFSNMGMFHVDVMTPIINPPEAAILALGTSKKEVVASEDDSWQIKPVATLSLTIDHAVTDGMPAARFLQTVVEIMEHPDKYL